MQAGTNYCILGKEYSNPDSLSSKKLRCVDNFIKEGDCLFDIGGGDLISLERSKFKEILGIDISEQSIRITKERFSKIHDSKSVLSIHQGQINDIWDQISYKKFDCVTSLDVLEHMSLKECIETLKLIHTLLDNDGIFIFTRSGFFEKIRIKIGLSPSHLHSHSSYGWAKIIRSAGFAIVTTSSVEFPIADIQFLREKVHLFGKCCIIVARK